MNATSNTRASVLAKGTWPSNVVSVLLSILLAVTLFSATALSQPAASTPQSPTGDLVSDAVAAAQLLDAPQAASVEEDAQAPVTVRAGEASAEAVFTGGELAAQEVLTQGIPALAKAAVADAASAEAADAEADAFRPDVQLPESTDAALAEAVANGAYRGARLYREGATDPVTGADGQPVQVLAAATVDGAVVYAVAGSDLVMELPAGSRVELGYEASAADESEKTPMGVPHLRAMLR